MDVTIEHGHRAEALQITERAAGILGSPAPLRINCPHRQMGEDDDAGRTAGDILFQPFELVVTQSREPSRFEPGLKIEDVDQPDKMDARYIKTVPAPALGILAVPREIGLAVAGIGRVVLAGNKNTCLFASLIT